MKIITWNINRFDGVWDWYEKKKDKDTKYREKMAKAIIGYLVKLISNEDDVAVLQEFPIMSIMVVFNGVVMSIVTGHLI